MKGQTAADATQDSPPADEPQPKRPRLEAPESEPAVVLDEHGDLRLCVGADHAEKPTTYLVCSRSLARSSLVMKKMLFGSFAESRPRGDMGRDDWVVQLPDDEPAPTQLMLDIIHGHFAKVPGTMDLDTLHALVVLLDKYDAISVTRPWAQAWLQSVKAGKNNPGTGRDSSKLLSVAWALGDLQLFSEMQSHLIEICEVDEGGHLIVKLFVSENGEVKSCLRPLAEETSPLIPPHVIEYMTTARAQWISTKLQPYLTIYQELTEGTWKCRTEPTRPARPAGPYIPPSPSASSSCPSRCEAMALGSLVGEFLKIGINFTDQDPASSYRGSLEVLKYDIDEGQIILVVPTTERYNHQDCRMVEVNQVKKWARMLIPLDTIGDDCRARLETQAKKTGLTSVSKVEGQNRHRVEGRPDPRRYKVL